MLYQLSLLLLLLLAAATAAATSSNGTLPGCPARCGNIDIPYPFGIGANCSREGFNLVCNETYESPKLYLADASIEVLDISLPDGEVRVVNSVATNMSFNPATVEAYTSFFRDLENGPFTVSESRNKFVAIGCGALARLTNPKSGESISICASICKDMESVADDGSCSGIGCCRTSLPKGIKSFNIRLDFLNQTQPGSNQTSLGNRAFLIEEKSFRFRASDIPSNVYNETTVVPAVLDWAIVSSRNCQNAKVNGTTGSFACRSDNSTCQDLIGGGFGYSCRCSPGFQGNPYIRGGCQDIDECADLRLRNCSGTCVNTKGGFYCIPVLIIEPKKVSARLAIFIGVGTACGFLVMIGGGTLCYRRLKERNVKRFKEKFFRQNRGLLLQQLISSDEDVAERTKIFTLEELDKATNNFDSTRILGRGGHGTVYKGILSDQRVVAIKKSKITVQSEIDQFINEVAILSQINHRNVVKLFGCCLETEVPLLVYQFVSNGTLSHHLHERESSLSWEDRLRIATETAGALSYLHSAASISVFHRDVKSSNILLDDGYTAKVSDFGASRSVALDQTRLTTVVQGTFGYLDPEYFHTGQLSQKSDVYSFGVILVELLTGKKPISPIPHTTMHENRNLTGHFIWLLRENRLFEVLEPRVVEEGRKDELEAVARLAETCLRLQGKERPTMREVEVRLEGLKRSEARQHPWVDAAGRDHQENQSLLPMPMTTSNSTSRQYSLENQMMLSASLER